MSKTNSWLCLYAIFQIGKPYWYGTYGQVSSESLYNSTVLPKLKSLGYSPYTNYKSQLNVKVHDCAGLVLGALMCSKVDGTPSGSAPIAHGATSQYNGNCKTKSNSMSNFPKIPGTLVFHSKGSTKTHVGIYVGTYIDKNGKEHSNVVVEAMNHASGVTTSALSNSKWDSWGQLSCCTIDTKTNTKFDMRTATKSGEMAAKDSITINTSAMSPFVATVLQGQNPKLDYNKIQEARISAMMFYGGELYDESHKQKSTYVNPYLNEQVSQCDNAGMPYALYVNVRSRNVIEADLECRTLYYIISRYPPSLGLWLSLQINNTVDINNYIMEIYYKYAEKWGLKDRIGLYVNETELAKITWDKFKDRFYLWMIKPMIVTTIDDELLQPEMFEVPD